VLVAQLGARRHYAVPLAFSCANVLQAFFTDVYVKSQVSRSLLSRLSRLPGFYGLARLQGRSSTRLPSRLVRSFPLFGYTYRYRVRRAKSEKERADAWIWGGRRFCELVVPSLGQPCDVVYGFSSAALELFEAAAEKGKRTCLDLATAPAAVEQTLIREESLQFPGWALHTYDVGEWAEYDARQRRELEIADLVVCGSSFARSMAMSIGIADAKLRTIPLAIGGDRACMHCGSRKGQGLRVLFVGNDGLRKGIGYLARAVTMLNASGLEVKVAGDLTISQAGLVSLSTNMELLGVVARTRIMELYTWADVLVLPSVSDTFGLVILEAMEAGLPVITTPNTGGSDVVRDGLDGFVVRIRDPEAIAEKLELLASDISLRCWMSDNARARAAEFSVERYGQRLVEACLS
jgi:glycosyltransferase involved in cell wall biosynthesis